MTNICFICKDYKEELYKICECVDSTLCDECFILSDRRNMVHCPICRRILNHKKSRNYTRTFFLIIKFLLLNLGLFFIPLIFPIYSLVNKTSNLSSVYFLVSLFSISILEPPILKYTTEFLGIKQSKYIISKIIIMSLLICLIFFINKNLREAFHFMVVILPSFIAPSTILSFSIVVRNISRIKEYINKKTVIKHLIFNKINNT